MTLLVLQLASSLFWLSKVFHTHVLHAVEISSAHSVLALPQSLSSSMAS
jgi:hypothetical protein